MSQLKITDLNFCESDIYNSPEINGGSVSVAVATGVSVAVKTGVGVNVNGNQYNYWGGYTTAGATGVAYAYAISGDGYTSAEAYVDTSAF
ncbi:MAG: hypothetical protein KA714_19250 [Limnoraphis sp. WC205]|nr:hypothetical protein [Limnoraphis sp. WC205]